MCGFAGEFTRSGRSPDRDSLIRMAESLVHRGPDDEGVWIGGPVGLASRRLSILDLSPAGRMPMRDDATGAALAYNGEIYNSPEMRRALEKDGVRFRSTSDTEVLLHLLIREGIAGLRRLRGMFAFAFWDPRVQELTLGRDPFGIKPLYYASTADSVVVASEIKAFWSHGGVDKVLSRSALAEFLQLGYVASPRTLFQGVVKLLPGHVLRIRQGQISSAPESYVPREVYLKRPENLEDEETLSVQLLETLRGSVRAHLLSDVPIGVFLSGGLDSSLIVACMSDAGIPGRVRSFSVGFEGPGEFNELDRARLIAKRFHTEHHELFLTAQDLADSILPLSSHLDEPAGDAALFPMFALSRSVRGLVKVVLTGEGSDEFFGGYRRYSAEAVASSWIGGVGRFGARALGGALELLPGLARSKRALAALRMAQPSDRAIAWQSIFFPHEICELVEGGSKVDPIRPRYHEFFAEALPVLGQVGALMYADQRTRLTDGYCEKVDRSTMAASLEARVPFLDAEVARFALRLPTNLKVRGLQLKYLLRKVAAKLLPSEIVGLPKRGFTVPVGHWFRSGLKSHVREALSVETLRRQGVFAPEAAQNLLNDFNRGRRAVAEKLWLVFAFQTWYQQSFLKRP